jgi:hypothetical protein
MAARNGIHTGGSFSNDCLTHIVAQKTLKIVMISALRELYRD